MKVKELIEQLKELDQDLDVYLAERTSDFGYGYLESVYTKIISFSESPGSRGLSRDRVCVLDENII